MRDDTRHHGTKPDGENRKPIEEARIEAALEALAARERAAALPGMGDRIVASTAELIEAGTPAPITLPPGRWRGHTGLRAAAVALLVVGGGAGLWWLGGSRSATAPDAGVRAVAMLDADIETWELLAESIGPGLSDDLALLDDDLRGVEGSIDLTADELFAMNGAL